MSTTGNRRKRSAAVFFASRFGTTEVVARAFERGLREAGLDTVCVRAGEVPPDSLKGYDLICLGGPTEVFSATKQVKEFLSAMRGAGLEGKFGFAFDTKLDSRFSGSAAKYIQNALDDTGLHMIAERESAVVTTRKDAGKIVGADLKAGEERRFEEIGARVGKATTGALEKIRGPDERQG